MDRCSVFSAGGTIQFIHLADSNRVPSWLDFCHLDTTYSYLLRGTSFEKKVHQSAYRKMCKGIFLKMISVGRLSPLGMTLLGPWSWMV